MWGYRYYRTADLDYLIQTDSSTNLSCLLCVFTIPYILHLVWHPLVFPWPNRYCIPCWWSCIHYPESGSLLCLDLHHSCLTLMISKLLLAICELRIYYLLVYKCTILTTLRSRSLLSLFVSLFVLLEIFQSPRGAAQRDWRSARLYTRIFTFRP